MKNLYISIIITILSFYNLNIFAECSCTPVSDLFCGTLAANPMPFEFQNIFTAVKTADIAYGMEVQVLDRLAGTEPNNILTVWGNNGDGLCRINTDEFAIGDTLILNLEPIWNNNPDLPNEQVGDYILSSCGLYYLRYVDDMIVGNAGANVDLSYDEFREYIISGDYLSFCSATSGIIAVSNLQFKVILEGAYNENNLSMKTSLRERNLLPANQPFNCPPWNYEGTESFGTSEHIPNEAVDWLLIELRKSSDNFQIVKQKAVLLLSNGFLLDASIQGNSTGVSFQEISLNESADFYISIKSRNHLGILSANTFSLTNDLFYDFTIPENVSSGYIQMSPINIAGEYAMRAGDFNSDGIITVTDYNFFKNQVSAIGEYLDSDCNFDGNVTVTDFNHFRPNISAIGVSQIRY